MYIFLLWFINFIQIFLIGYQTKNITENRYYKAMLTQAGISIVQVIFVHFAVTMALTPACLVMGSSGAMGIIVGIWFHRKD